MAQAECQNDGCRHGWTLRKAPDEYESQIRCPECGSTRVEIAPSAAEVATGGQGEYQSPGGGSGHATSDQAQAQAQPQEQAQPAQQAQAAQPAKPAQAVQPAQQGQGEGQGPGSMLPDTASQQAIETGLAAGDAVGTLMDGSNAEKAQALGGALFQVGQHLARREQNAKNASQSDIKAVDEFVRCEVCDGQLTNIPASGRFTCPHCGELLEI